MDHYDRIKLHVTDCETCRAPLGFIPEHLAKHLGIEDRGAVGRALDKLVIDRVLSKLRPVSGSPWRGRTRYIVRGA